MLRALGTCRGGGGCLSTDKYYGWWFGSFFFFWEGEVLCLGGICSFFCFIGTGIERAFFFFVIAMVYWCFVIAVGP